MQTQSPTFGLRIWPFPQRAKTEPLAQAVARTEAYENQFFDAIQPLSIALQQGRVQISRKQAGQQDTSAQVIIGTTAYTARLEHESKQLILQGPGLEKLVYERYPEPEYRGALGVPSITAPWIEYTDSQGVTSVLKIVFCVPDSRDEVLLKLLDGLSRTIKAP